MTQRRLALAALLVAALAPAASQAAAAPRTGVGAYPDSALVPAESEPAAGCDAQSMLADPGPAGATGSLCVFPDLESEQAYLVETARPGSTMRHQGIALAVARLHPMFVHRLAEAVREARVAGLASAGIFSAYRPPAFGVGGFSDKFNSLHTYGLAVDMLGVGGPGSSEAKLWYEIAARHGIVCPYGAANRREWNHCQPTRVKSIMAGDPLRGTVSQRGPIDRQAMFALGDALVNGIDGGANSPELQPWLDEKRPQGATGQADSIETGHDQANPSHASDRRAKLVAGSAANAYRHETHSQPKRRIVAENVAIKSGPVNKYRTAGLIRHASLNSAPSHEHAPAKRIEHENARLDRSIKGICRGC